MKAAIVQADKTVKIEERPVPEIKPNEILLKVVAIGLNPTDWKHVTSFSKAGDIIGCDFVGKVAQLGADVPKDEIKEGEIRWGFTRGGIDSKQGGFVEYVAVAWDLTSVVPPNLTPEQAASLPIPFMTAVQALYLNFGVTEPPNQEAGEHWILVWSGATAVGRYTIQLAKLSGLKVATTASKKNWELLKGYGADVVIDYKDPDVANKLKEATGDSIEYAFDCISEGGSTKIVEQAFRPAGGQLLALLFDLGELTRPEVKTHSILAYVLLGTPQSWGEYKFESRPEDRKGFVRWAKKATDLLARGEVKTIDIEVVGGLDKIQEALGMLQSGANSKKLVLTVP